MRHAIRAILVCLVLVLGAGRPARAQAPAGNVVRYGLSAYYAAPGNYATSLGVPSFGWPRTYTEFSSPYGAGYGYGYYPYTVLPGYYGVRLWRPGFSVPGYLYGAGYYATASTPGMPLTGPVPPSIGAYAPGFGPPPFFSW